MNSTSNPHLLSDIPCSSITHLTQNTLTSTMVVYPRFYGRTRCSSIIFNDLGSYGTTPRPVLEASNELTLEIESNPDLFHRLTYQKRLVGVREKLARLIGAKTDEIVLVPNASMGVNTILRNFEWEQDDQIFVCT
jgi:selenocysteine lyase/cysteine desulfurase